jgi:hypothetical protein
MAECHKCGRKLTTVHIDAVSVRGGRHQWNGAAYACPSCNVVLGVEIDPIALKADIVAEVVDQIRRLLRP